MFAFSTCKRGLLETTSVLLVMLFVLAGRGAIIPSRDDGSTSVIIRHVGVVISEKDQFFNRTTTSECECRANCQVASDRCRGYSFNKLTHSCRLADAIHPGATEQGGVFVYTLPTGLPYGTKRLGDGLYYVRVLFANVTQAEARNRCSKLPDFRLAQAKSLQTMKIIKAMWKNASLAKLWRDDFRCGTSFPLTAPFEGVPSQCDPASIRPCCSNYYYCGNTSEFCTCVGCVDYRKDPTLDFWIDLNKVPTTGAGGMGVAQWSWGDGTALNQSLLDTNEPVVNVNGVTGAAFIASFKVQAAGGNASLGYLCQANYDDVTW